jgi:hypothetical protein
MLRQQQRSVLDALDGVRLAGRQVQEFTGLKVMGLAEASEGNLPFQALDDDLAFGLVLGDVLTSSRKRWVIIAPPSPP